MRLLEGGWRAARNLLPERLCGRCSHVTLHPTPQTLDIPDTCTLHPRHPARGAALNLLRKTLLEGLRLLEGPMWRLSTCCWKPCGGVRPITGCFKTKWKGRTPHPDSPTPNPRGAAHNLLLEGLRLLLGFMLLPLTPHPTPCTLHPAPCTLHPAPPTPCTL